MILDRKKAFDCISRMLAIIRLDIEHHQAINDQSLHIHGENYFRDIFNFVYNCNFRNANQEKHNTEYIDLIDTGNKKLIQITTTRTKEKILHSLKSLHQNKYNDYEIFIYFLLDKANPTIKTIKEIENEYPVNLKGILKDYRDLIRDIESLEENKLIELSNRYFEEKKSAYTDEIVLDLVFKKLLKEKSNILISYDDDLGSIETNEKIVINNINQRIAQQIRNCLDYTCIIDSIDAGELGTNLRHLIVDELYKEILIKQLKSRIREEDLLLKDVQKLQKIAVTEKLDFNKLIYLLHHNIENLITIKDFNSMDISWILLSYFFEICDVGMREHDTAN